jgi:hypothetical protein
MRSTKLWERRPIIDLGSMRAAAAHSDLAPAISFCEKRMIARE